MCTASATVTILGKLGLHARPAMVFAEIASRYEADVEVSRTDTEAWVNGKSGMAMLTLVLGKGTEIRIRAAGADAGAVVDVLTAFVEAEFEEAERDGTG